MIRHCVPCDIGLDGKGGRASINPMLSNYFVGRKVRRASADEGLPLWQDHVFMILQKNAANPTDYCRLPPNRVIELAMQVTI